MISDKSEKVRASLNVAEICDLFISSGWAPDEIEVDILVKKLAPIMLSVATGLPHHRALKFCRDVAFRALRLREFRKIDANPETFRKRLSEVNDSLIGFSIALDGLFSHDLMKDALEEMFLCQIWPDYVNKTLIDRRRRRIFDNLREDLEHFHVVLDCVICDLDQNRKIRYSPFEYEFVWECAHLWKTATNKNPALTRNRYDPDREFEMRSPFHRFVSTAVEPAGLPEGLIRDVLEAFCAMKDSQIVGK